LAPEVEREPDWLSSGRFQPLAAILVVGPARERPRAGAPLRQVPGHALSELAITQFFDENNLSAERSEVGPYQCHRHEDLRIYQGDFFAAPELGQRYRLVYDRAALIALPGAMRRQYAALMSRLVEAGGQVLLVTLEYQPEQQLQPPFSVGEMEVRTLFERDFGVEVLGRGAELDHPRVLSGQLSYFDEVAYRLIRRG